MSAVKQETEDAKRAAELPTDLRLIREKIVRGLVKLAASESEPEEDSDDRRASPKVKLSERKTALKQALEDLRAPLIEFNQAIDKPATSPRENPSEDAQQQRLDQASESAIAIIARLIPLVDDASEDQLQSIAEKASKPIADLINEWCPVPKIFVAVHGIGDQFQNATVQSVAFRVCDYVGAPPALPMGRFHGPNATVTGAFIPESGRDPTIECGFAEIYWADVPRRPAAGRVLEEPKHWARSLVSRLSLRSAAQGAAASEEEKDNERIGKLIEEMIDGVAIADRMVFLADKAGLFTFDLKTLLNDYLNDVQVVTEFEEYRNRLLKIFDRVLSKIHRYFSKSEVYIIAHSEGTVVAFMGLLQGLSQSKPWAPMVRGFMTIGSPLNKHVRLWPELFNAFQANQAQPFRGPIPWKNYFDYGDPIAYDLKPTREWIEKSGWGPFFAFNDRDDHGFTRYFFPGAAHNDYWRDPEVFGHFIETVVIPENERDNPVLPRKRKEPYGDRPPQTIPAAQILSYALPYVLAAALLLLACYPLYKTVRGSLDPDGAKNESAHLVLQNVGGLAGLIAAMSLLARMPVLTKKTGWRIAAVGLAALFSVAYLFGMSPDNQRSIERFLVDGRGSGPLINPLNLGLAAILLCGPLVHWRIRFLRPVAETLLPVLACVLLFRATGAYLSDSGWLPRLPDPLSWRALGVIVVAWTLGFASWGTFWRHPKVGVKPLVHTGALVIGLVVVAASQAAPQFNDATNTPQWPILLGFAGFLYLWWLAIIMFDLTFIWHLYIRHSGAETYMAQRLPATNKPSA